MMSKESKPAEVKGKPYTKDDNPFTKPSNAQRVKPDNLITESPLKSVQEITKRVKVKIHYSNDSRLLNPDLLLVEISSPHC
jgi:hypothetical protein